MGGGSGWSSRWAKALVLLHGAGRAEVSSRCKLVTRFSETFGCGMYLHRVQLKPTLSRKRNQMSAKTRTCAIIAGLTLGLAITPAMAQTEKTEKTEKKTTTTKMDKMDNSSMSVDEKAAAFDKMSDKKKTAAMKMAGHDMSKMTEGERISMMSRMTAQEKADAYDKGMSGKKGSANKMDKMDKTDKTGQKP
jgi:hypothetical protein